MIVGEFYPAVPNKLATGTGRRRSASNGQTADTIRISTTTTNRGNRFEVVRTGTGDITISAGRDVQLRNQFSTIYTAGVALPDAHHRFQRKRFRPARDADHRQPPSRASRRRGLTLGAVQQIYPADLVDGGRQYLHRGPGRTSAVTRWSMACSPWIPAARCPPTGSIAAVMWIPRPDFSPQTAASATESEYPECRAISTMWRPPPPGGSITAISSRESARSAAATSSLAAGTDIVNVDAVAPTNARMPGRMKNPDFGVVAGRARISQRRTRCDEAAGTRRRRRHRHRRPEHRWRHLLRRTGQRHADCRRQHHHQRRPLAVAGHPRRIQLRSIRSPGCPPPSLSASPQFDVTARGDVLLGPVTNPFLLPQGLNNKLLV